LVCFKAPETSQKCEGFYILKVKIKKVVPSSVQQSCAV
jgi:hypothetical protein